MPRLAVTGANGFVGRHLVASARAAGWEVAGVVRSREGAMEVERAGGAPIVVPALDSDVLTPAFAGAHAIAHLAQIGSEGAGTFEAVNVEATRRVADAAARAGVRRIVFFSGLGVARYGMARRTTNRYFLSKLRAEAELFHAGLAVDVFRPSYVVGPGDGLVRALLQEMAEGVVERPGDGRYRMQPVAVADAACAILAAAAGADAAGAGTPHRVCDLVGPEPIGFDAFVARLAARARARGLPAEYEVRAVSVGEADRQARSGGYRGMRPDELDCMLCDEVADPAPLAALLGRPLMPLDAALDAALT